MAAGNLDAADLKGVAFGGLINEDVMQQIWDISKIPLPLTDMIGTVDVSNDYKEWTTDKQANPNTSNAVVDGSDQTGDDSATGERVGNYCQESVKKVRVSTRARNSDTIGRTDELAYQIMMRQQDLRRDVEAIMLTEQQSRADDGNTVAGLSAGLFAMIRDTGQATPGNALVGATGARPGFSSGTFTAPTAGTTRALTETLIRDAAELSYIDGGNPAYMMGVPQLIRKISEYLFTSSARIAALYSETGQAAEAVTAKGSVNVFATDYGITLEMVPNRLMQVESATRTNLAIIDPQFLAIGYLTGYQVDELAKLGLADNRLMCVDWVLVCKSFDAQSTICDIDHTQAVTQ